MIVLKGKNCGFCFGVKRAVKKAESLHGDGNYILGEIIHNETVNEKLRKSGIITIDDISDERLKRGDTLLIRTHGEPRSTFVKAEEIGLNVIDCTCPFVNEIHNIVREKYAAGYKIVIIGNAEHPEIKGINGWCEGTASVVSNNDELSKVEGAIPVDRANPGIKSLLAAIKPLKQGKKLAISPEGTRNKTGSIEMLPFKDGTVMFAVKGKAQIVPCIVSRRAKLFRTTHMMFGKPFDFSEYYDKKLTDEDFAAMNKVLVCKMKKTQKELLDLVANLKKKKVKRGKKACNAKESV